MTDRMNDRMNDRIKDRIIKIVYHQTKEMVGDYMTKALQGSLFRTHRNSIMGLTEDPILMYDITYREQKLAIKKL